MLESRIRRALAVGAVAAVAGIALAPAAGDADRARGPAAPGAYEGDAFDERKEPSGKEWVRFKVSRDGRAVKRFSARVWVICYVGPPTYNTTLPTVFRVPRAAISRSGAVDHDWTEPYTVDGEEYELEGHMTLRFRKGKPVTGKVRLAFADCGTTTGDPPGYMRIRAERKR